MEDYKLKKLDGDNYHAWAIRARAIMVQKKCWEAVDPGYGQEMTDTERKKNDEALTLMFLIVEDTFLDDIGDCIRAKDAWIALKEMHTKFGLLHVLQLMKDFFNITMKPGETVQSYLARLMEIHRKLSNGGYAFTDREVALVMLIGLPKSYESLILNLEKDEANLTTTIVKSKLLIEEKRISRNANTIEDREEHALHTKSYNQRKHVQTDTSKSWQPKKSLETNTNAKKNTKCFSCGKWGHISKYCDEAKRSKQVSAKTAVDLKGDWALSVNHKGENKSSFWILDSGATEHMTSDKTKYSNFRHYESTVEVANSEKIEVTGIGDIILRLHESGETVTLANVLFVPNLGGNLLSLGRIEERGFRVEFAAGEAKIIEGSGKIVLTAKRNGRLYIVEELSPKAYAARTASDDLWHRRLGHPNHESIKKLYPDLKTSESEVINDLCTICIQGKMKRKKFPKIANTRAEETLEIIHADVVGKITPSSLGGSNYFVTFIDDYTRHTTVYPIRSKDEVLSKFKEYKQMAENFHNKKIKILRSDNGGEFRSREFDHYLAQHGIRRQATVPESPQQNGVSERKQQTLLNMTRCLLIESGLDQRFWAEAVSTAAYLLNKCPSTSIQGNIPEEMWHGKKVQTSHLRIFGCRAWSQVRSNFRKKLDVRATECILVGYPEGTKGYRLT